MQEEGDFNIGWGYLAIINGVPWLAATSEEAKSQIPATMIRLDPRLLEEQRDTEKDEQFFLYRGPLQAPR